MAWKRFVWAFDPHGDKADPEATRPFFKFVEHYRPHERGIGGDLYNFAALRKGANEEEKRESLVTDYHKGCEFRDRLQPTKSVRGNHCERLWDWAKAANGPAADLALMWCNEIEEDARKRKCEMVGYGKRSYLPIGNSSDNFVAHGTAHGMAAARNMAMAFASVGNVFFGHGHQFQTFSLPTIKRRSATMVPCLCVLDQDYNRAHNGTLAQEHGWLYGEWNDSSGEVIAHVARRTSGGRFRLATGVEEL